MNSVKHVAIIMDGNGRWGIKYKKSRNLGHKEGLKAVEKIIISKLRGSHIYELTGAQPFTYKSFYLHIARCLDVKRFYIPIQIVDMDKKLKEYVQRIKN